MYATNAIFSAQVILWRNGEWTLDVTALDTELCGWVRTAQFYNLDGLDDVIKRLKEKRAEIAERQEGGNR